MIIVLITKLIINTILSLFAMLFLCGIIAILLLLDSAKDEYENHNRK